MARHTLTDFTLDLPDELTLDDVKGVANLAGLTFEEWLSRCVVEHTRQAALYFADPEVKAYYDLHQSFGPINSTPGPRK